MFVGVIQSSGLGGRKRLERTSRIPVIDPDGMILKPDSQFHERISLAVRELGSPKARAPFIDRGGALDLLKRRADRRQISQRRHEPWNRDVALLCAVGHVVPELEFVFGFLWT